MTRIIAKVPLIPKKKDFVPDPIMDAKPVDLDKVPGSIRKNLKQKVSIVYPKPPSKNPVPEHQEMGVLDTGFANTDGSVPSTNKTRSSVVKNAPAPQTLELAREALARKHRGEPEPESEQEQQSSEYTTVQRIIRQPVPKFIAPETESIPSVGDAIDWKNVEEMLKYGCDQVDVAAFYCVTISELKRRCEVENNKPWDLFVDQCFAIMRRNLKLMQYKKAMGYTRKGVNGATYFIPPDPGMLIHLGKHVLGQNDKMSLKELFNGYIIEDGISEEQHQLPSNVIDGKAVIMLDDDED